MKRTLPLVLVLALLTSCTGGPNEAAKTPEELTQAYADAITAAQGEEFSAYFPVMSDAENDLAEMTFAMLGLTEEDMTAYGIALSLRNITAYAICAIMPASGREEAVQTGLETFVETQKANFQHYLEDQYQVARSARLESLKDGTLLLVMCEDGDKVFNDIKATLEG